MLTFFFSLSGVGEFNALYDVCYPVLKIEWNAYVEDVSVKEVVE